MRVAALVLASALAMLAWFAPDLHDRLRLGSADRNHRPPYKWACLSSAEEGDGSRIDLTFMVKPDGVVSERQASWRPQTIAGNKSEALVDHGLNLFVEFDAAAAADRLGTPSAVHVSISGGPKPPPHGEMSALLTLDKDRTWAAQFDPSDGGEANTGQEFYWSQSFPMAIDNGKVRPLNIDLLGAIEGARTAMVEFKNHDGQVVSRRSFDLTHAHRACLAAAAWKLAENRAQHPAHSDNWCGAPGPFERLGPPDPRVDC